MIRALQSLSPVPVALGLASIVSACCADPWPSTMAPEVVFDAADDDVDETIEDVPLGVNDCLEPTDLEALEAVGMTVYSGGDPPDVTGEYLLDSLEITWDDSASPPYPPIESLELFLENQTAEGTLDQSLTATSGLNDGGGEAFIAGSGGCFTVFVCFEAISETIGGECQISMPQLFSGCLSESGVEELQYGYRMGQLEGSCDKVVQVGHRRVMEESDGLAERQGQSD